LNDSNPKEEPPAVRTPLDRVLDFLESFWKSRKQSDGIYHRLIRWCRLGVIILNVSYLLALCLVLLLLEFYGERNLTLCLLLYLPPQGWLLPLAALVPINLLIHPRWALVAPVSALIVIGIYMDWQWRNWETPEGSSLVVMSNNVGQNNKQSMRPFMADVNPSIVVLQEAGRKGAFERDYPDWNVDAHGEFTLLSRHPILEVRPINEALYEDQTVAVRFLIEWENQKIAIYNTHFPSPRDQLKALAGKPLALGLIGFGPLKEKRIAYHESWLARVETADALAAIVSSDPLPSLLVGDLNFPNHGAGYHRASEHLTDCFEEKGRGFGFTFPGTSRNPLTGFGPWMRIDYIFCNSKWNTLKAVSEKDRTSQHRAISASLELSP